MAKGTVAMLFQGGAMSDGHQRDGLAVRSIIRGAPHCLAIASAMRSNGSWVSGQCVSMRGCWCRNSAISDCKAIAAVPSAIAWYYRATAEGD